MFRNRPSLLQRYFLAGFMAGYNGQIFGASFLLTSGVALFMPLFSAAINRRNPHNAALGAALGYMSGVMLAQPQVLVQNYLGNSPSKMKLR